MYLKRAIEVYQTTASATTPMMDTIIELLNEMSHLLGETQATIERQKSSDVSESLRKLQQVLFELIGVVDQQTEEGKRLVLLYVILNQNLVTVQLYKRYELLQDVQVQVDQLAEAWTAARQQQRRHRFTTDIV
ncbi:flagellar protein FliS [Sporosarcina sp. GW1-11]|uniref:flagellar protein FliS n=1 Tax=Sporosarcina sp. GW1-11 TaxID=2899126 RepID=UPI00294D6FF9|nr:flagellar protein FliS [Sporosarcina sp. GW1-11]MDV6377002.1 flagellar protein FliS [Sporosarcina sp. GW1-11]